MSCGRESKHSKENDRIIVSREKDNASPRNKTLFNIWAQVYDSDICILPLLQI